MKQFDAKSLLKEIGVSMLRWDWTKQLLYWIILSAGTMSECVFLIASLWMSINSNVHPFILLFMSEATSIHISELATAAYVALPECIVALACVTVISHIRMWLYDHTISSGIWSLLYGLPTLVFLVLSVITLGCSVASTHFIMPEPLVIVRAIAAFMFAFTSLLYTRLGVPQERDKLQEKDDCIAIEREKNADQSGEIEKLKADLLTSKNAQTALLNTAYKSDETALQAYSEECLNWLKSGVKTVLSEEITRFTGHSKRRIETAITKGYLQVSPRNKDLITVSSLVIWLRNTPPSDTGITPFRIVKEA